MTTDIVSMWRQIGIALLASFCVCIASHAADVIIVNADAPGQGLNDPTPAAPEGGNPGTTLGQQRTILLQRVAEIWGAKLESAVPIRVQVSFSGDPSVYPCATNPGDFVYLASSGPTAYYTVNPPYPDPDHPIVYPAALRNALVGEVADPSTPEIAVQISSRMDTVPDCITGFDGYWYGIDPDIASPASPSQFPLLTLLLHEFAHGLGFIEGANLSNGSVFPPYHYIFNTLLYDTQIGKFWTDMTDEERLASATNAPNLVWTGENVAAAEPEFMRQPLRLRIDAAAQSGEVLQAYYGPLLPRSGLAAQAALVNDGSANPDEGCGTLVNPAQIQGRIAVVNRGTCNFSTKSQNAQQAGAIATLILNNRAETPDDPLPKASSTDFTVRIPTATVAYQAGLNLVAALGSTPNALVTVEAIPGSEDVGTHAGFVRMFAPATVQPKSSVSHFVSDADSATPLLMQPAIVYALFDRTDMTVDLLRDLGWPVAAGDLVFKDGFDGAN